ncbi:1-(5-phosphoribosyl)-5-[(5-phosphoribosylamino)methylideneamino] imidazole-4-carboxamide isomerase [Rapidithrix thailandica]|uniref:1-(5-phosphoribosyl)-5-[(5-phosphoribosylamino)methylideneamino] imidazole-4-carboxamide isomerase n=1 Tax=Rapidithrix thailandica TaxID=413964 RepID=A0AAW9SB99_9BACT
MIEIIPSISVIEGKCVKLQQGDYNKKVVYDQSPIDIAKKFEDHGIKKLHLIDLDGALEGRVINYDILELITGHTDLEVNFGGGINTDGDINKVYEYGAKSVTVGSLAIYNKHLFASWLISFGRNKICLSADAMDGKIRVRGWQNATDLDLMDFVDYYYQRSVLYVKCSDVSRDGLLQGPAFGMYQSLIQRFPKLRIIASGGISSVADIHKLEELGVHGVIIGKAYYEGKVSLKEIEHLQSR